MTSIPVARFERLLRELSPAEREAFVADLWAARGWETTVEDVVVASRSDPPETRRIQVLDAGRRLLGDRPAVRDDVDVVVAIGSAPATGDVAVLGARDLRDMALYGVDRGTLDDLFATYFGRPVGAFAADASRVETLRDAVANPSPRSIVLGIVVVAVVIAAGSSALVGTPDGPPGDAAAGAGTTEPGSFTPAPTVRLVPSTDTPTTRGRAVCPPPPDDVHPRELRPVVGPGAGTLADWEVVVVQNGSSIRGSNVTPLIPTYTADYVGPEPIRYRMIIQRWRTRGDAYRTGDPLHSSLYTRLVWGRYSVAVEPELVSGANQSVLATRDDINRLLAAVRVPGGGTLGEQCASQLLT